MIAKKLLTDIMTYAGGDFLVLAVGGFLLIPLYTRHMSPSDYGMLVAVRTNAEIFTYILQFGVISAVARVYFSFRKKQQHRKYISSVLIFHFVSAAILSCGFALAGRALWMELSPSLPAVPYMWFALGLALLSYVPALYSILLRVEEKAQAFAAAQIASAGLLVLLALLFLVGCKAGLSGVLWALVLHGLINWGVFLILLCRKLTWGFDPEHLTASLKFGLPMLTSYLAYFFVNRFGILFLQRHVGLEELGLFGFAQQLAMAVSLVSVAIGKSLQPMIYAIDESALTTTISHLNRVYFLAMFLVTATIACFASEILAVVAPRAYSHTYLAFVLLVIANMIYALKLVSESVILYRYHPNVSMAVSIAGAVLSILCNLWLVPRFGINGAVGASVITAAAVTTTSMAIARGMVPFRMGMPLAQTGVAAGILVAFAVFMNGRMPIVYLVPLKTGLLCLLGTAFYAFHAQCQPAPC